MTKKRVAPARRLQAKKPAQIKAKAQIKPQAKVQAKVQIKAKVQAKVQIKSQLLASRPKRRISFKSDGWYALAVQRFGIRTGGAPAAPPSEVDRLDRHVV